MGCGRSSINGNTMKPVNVNKLTASSDFKANEEQDPNHFINSQSTSPLKPEEKETHDEKETPEILEKSKNSIFGSENVLHKDDNFDELYEEKMEEGQEDMSVDILEQAVALSIIDTTHQNYHSAYKRDSVEYIANELERAFGSITESQESNMNIVVIDDKDETNNPAIFVAS